MLWNKNVDLGITFKIDSDFDYNYNSNILHKNHKVNFMKKKKK